MYIVPVNDTERQIQNLVDCFLPQIRFLALAKLGNYGPLLWKTVLHVLVHSWDVHIRVLSCIMKYKKAKQAVAPKIQLYENSRLFYPVKGAWS